MRTKYISKSDAKRLGLSRYPSAGPRPNITGMKRLYWGKDALCIKAGAYVYCVPWDVYTRA